MESHDKLCDLDKEQSSCSNLIIKSPRGRLSSGFWYLPSLVYFLDQFNNVTALGNLLKSKSNSGLSVSQGGRPGSRGSQVCWRCCHVVAPLKMHFGCRELHFSGECLSLQVGSWARSNQCPPVWTPAKVFTGCFLPSELSSCFLVLFAQEFPPYPHPMRKLDEYVGVALCAESSAGLVLPPAALSSAPHQP